MPSMMEANSSPETGSLDQDALIKEILRRTALQDERLDFTLSDADLIRLLAEARNSVSQMSDTVADIPVTMPNSDTGQTTVLVPKSLVLIFAELCHKIRQLCSQQWTEVDEHARLFHDGELLDAAHTQAQLSEPEKSPPDSRQLYLATVAEIEALAYDIRHSCEPDPTFLEGSMHINVPALHARAALMSGVRDRLQRIFDIPPVQIGRSMRGWPKWMDRITHADESDVDELHDLYNSVLLTSEQLAKLDPYYATPDEFHKVAELIRGRGAMFGKMLPPDGDNEVREAIRAGIVTVFREDPDDDNVNHRGQLLGYYSVLSAPDVVQKHMSQEFGYSSESRYNSTADLPHDVHRDDVSSSRKKTIVYRDKESALRVFQAASNGTLAWSVDHVVRMDGDQKFQTYAELGTALKKQEYRELEEQGMTCVLLKIATVLAVDASGASVELDLNPCDVSAWEVDGEYPWKVDETGKVILECPIANVGSSMLNIKLGAHETILVTEEFERDGIKIRILWSYYVQTLPPRTP